MDVIVYEKELVKLKKAVEKLKEALVALQEHPLFSGEEKPRKKQKRKPRVAAEELTQKDNEPAPATRQLKAVDEAPKKRAPKKGNGAAHHAVAGEEATNPFSGIP